VLPSGPRSSRSSASASRCPCSGRPSFLNPGRGPIQGLYAGTIGQVVAKPQVVAASTVALMSTTASKLSLHNCAQPGQGCDVWAWPLLAFLTCQASLGRGFHIKKTDCALLCGRFDLKRSMSSQLLSPTIGLSGLCFFIL